MLSLDYSSYLSCILRSSVNYVSFDEVAFESVSRFRNKVECKLLNPATRFGLLSNINEASVMYTFCIYLGAFWHCHSLYVGLGLRNPLGMCE